MSKPKNPQARKSDRTVPVLTSYDDSTSDDAEPIWGFGDLRKNVFYACLSFFDYNRNPTQLTEYVKPMDGLPVRSPENNNTTKLLDQLALLFARFKNSSLPPKSATDGLFPSSTGENVTATALQMPPGQPWTIHFTKNAGPLEYDDWSDQYMLKTLEKWYSRLEARNPAHLDQSNKIWGALEGFWLRRTSFCFDKLKEIHRRLIIDLEREESDLLALLLHVYGKCDDVNVHGTTDETPCRLCQEREDHVKADFEHARKLLQDLNFDDGSEKAVNAQARHIWFNDDLPWYREYTKIQLSDLDGMPSKAQERDKEEKDKKKKYKKERDKEEKDKRERVSRVNRFRDAIKYLRLTGIPKSVLKKLLTFKKNNPQVELKFKFLERKSVQPIRAKGIVDALDTTWKSEMSRSCKTFKVHMKTAQTALQKEDEPKEHLGTSGQVGRTKPEGIHRYFHCELQMLDQFLDVTDVYEYFGCSKLSCYLCWCVLLGSETVYRTKYTHRKLGMNSAFPFRNLENRKEKFESLAMALKNIESHLCKYISAKARLEDKDYYLTANSGASDTNREHTGLEEEEEEDDDSDNDEVKAQRNSQEALWNSLDGMVRNKGFDPESPLLSGLERNEYTAVHIPQVDDPKLLNFTAYNMYSWGARRDASRGIPFAWDDSERKHWYPEYQFQVFDKEFDGQWVREQLENNYCADIFQRRLKEGQPSKHTNQWWHQETSDFGIEHCEVREVFVWLGVGASRPPRFEPYLPDLHVAVDAVRKFARDRVEQEVRTIRMRQFMIQRGREG